MKIRVRNIIIILSLVAVTLPFILVTDLFPFMRFGMFAEPVKHTAQTESFILTYLTREGKEKVFDPQEIGIEPHFFFYLTRNYYYRKESTILFEKVERAAREKDIREWRLKKITTGTRPPYRQDTAIVARKPHE